jgi:hypothetical protein
MGEIAIAQNMSQFIDANPDLKYIFFGGKGGVGKTVLAGAAAVAFARRGRRTLLASTNPVHSLSGLLDMNVFGKSVAVDGVPNLWAYEIDTKDTIERSKKDIREKIGWFLKFAEIKGKADEFIESATMNPAFEESAMFENMIDLMFKDEGQPQGSPDDAHPASLQQESAGRKRPANGLPGRFPGTDAESQKPADRPGEDLLLFCDFTGGAPNCRDPALYQLVP